MIETGIQSHVVARLFGKDVYVDADGIARGKELIQKMLRVEKCKKGMHIRPFNVSEKVIPFYEDVCLSLRHRLIDRFGRWPDFAAFIRERVTINIY